MANRLQKGFSLLETLVAFLVLALSLGIIAQIFGRGAEVQAISNKSNQAVILGDSLMAHAPYILDDNMQSRGHRNGMQWHILSTPYRPTVEVNNTIKKSDEHVALNRIVIEVHWQVHGRDHLLRLTGLQPVNGH